MVAVNHHSLFFQPHLAYAKPSIMTRNALIIFIKNPEKGKVKTRLSADVGADRALRIYRALLTHTRQVALAVSVDRLLFYGQYIAQDDEWKDPHFDKHCQVEGDLGTRMEAAFAKALNNYEKAIIIGSDCASLTSGIIERAFLALDEVDAVVGPAMDGGYYLLGMKTLLPEIFRGIPWSTQHVFPETIARLRANGYQYALVDTLSDIDYAADWEKYGWELE